MFREAFREIRFHPSRFIATLVAIAISVGFMAGISIFVASQGSAMGKMLAIQTSAADIVVTANSPKEKVTADQVKKAIASVPGVTDVVTIDSGSSSIKGPQGERWVEIVTLPPEQFRWSQIAQGAWPSKPTDIALTPSVAEELGVGVGDTISTVLTSNAKLTVSGITNDPKNPLTATAYMAQSPYGSSEEWATGNYLVKISQDTTLNSVIGALKTAVSPLGNDGFHIYEGDRIVPAMDVLSSSDYRQHTITTQLAGVQPLKYIMMVFAAIALLVGMIIIANTFSILLAQRRRQIGLLRAVGASGGQVRGRFLAESTLLGLIGSALGVGLGFGLATIGLVILGFLSWGLEVPWTELIIAIVVGTLITVIAAMGPSLRATQVAPLEALRPVPTVEQRKKASRVRAIICGIFVVLGAGLAGLSLASKSFALLSAVGGSFLLTIGILGAAPLFIPALLRGVSRVLDRAGATPRLASMNAVRNPSRASATATALMLTVGLIVTLQVGAATARKTATAEIDATFPVDLKVVATQEGSSVDPDGKPAESPKLKGFSPEMQQTIAGLPNVAASVPVLGTTVTSTSPNFSEDSRVPTLGFTPRINDVLNDPLTLDDNTILVNKMDYKDGDPVTLKGPSGTVTGKAKNSHIPEGFEFVVSEANLRKLDPNPAPLEVWLKLTNRTQFAGVMSDIQKLKVNMPNMGLNGAAPQAAMINQILDIMLLVTTALLGVAVVIALVGVANTLGLSVVERKRESALLRALGMQRASLRWMLLIEALILALVGTLVGVLAGAFFGWLGVKAVFTQSETNLDHGIQFAVDWRWTLGMIAVSVLAASLASVGPGRKAAMASPTEALGDE